MKGEKNEEAVPTKESTVTETIRGKRYEALIAAIGKAVEKLGKVMAVSFSEVIGQKKPN